MDPRGVLNTDSFAALNILETQGRGRVLWYHEHPAASRIRDAQLHATQPATVLLQDYAHQRITVRALGEARVVNPVDPKRHPKIVRDHTRKIDLEPLGVI